MFNKLARGIGHKSGGKQSVKYRFDVLVEKLDNLPGPVRKCRVVWSRGPKLQMTEFKDVNKGAVMFNQKLSQIATMFRDPAKGFEAKEYKIQVQVPGKEDGGKVLTVGKAEIDLSLSAATEGKPQSKMIPVLFKVGAASTGYLKAVITAEMVTGAIDDDGMTEVSALTGMTTQLDGDQDLSGFEDEAEDLKCTSAPVTKPSISKRSSQLAEPPAAVAEELSLRGPAAPKAANGLPQAGGGAAAAAAAAGAKAASQKPSNMRLSKAAAAAADSDGEISPMELSPSSSAGAPPRDHAMSNSREVGKRSVVDAGKSRSAASSSASKDARAQLFGSNSGSSGSAAAGRATSRGSAESIDTGLTEDEARAALFGAGVGRLVGAQGKAAGQKGGNVANANSSNAISNNISNSQSSRSTALPIAIGKPIAAAAVQPSRSLEAASVPSPSAASSGSLTAVSSSIAVGGRRGLLDREGLNGRQDAAAAGYSAATRPSSNKPTAVSAARAHSLSDADEDEAADRVVGAQALKPPSARQGSAASKDPSSATAAAPPKPAAPPATATADAVAGDAAAKQLAAENEKLRAQLAVLRDQAAQAEDARRQARLAAENAAADNADYKEQVRELQEQLKEVAVGMLPLEEGQQLQEQVALLQQQLNDQQQDYQQALQERLTAAHQLNTTWQDLQMQLAASQAQVLKLQQEVCQLQQQQEQQQSASLPQCQESKGSSNSSDVGQSKQNTDGLREQLAEALAQVDVSGVLATQAERHKSELEQQVSQLRLQLKEAQQLAQASQQQAAAATSAAAAALSTSLSPNASADAPALSNMVVDVRAKLADSEQRGQAARQLERVFALLLKEVEAASQLHDIQEQMQDVQLQAGAQEMLASMAGLGPGVCAMAAEVLLGIKAAAAAVRTQANTGAQLRNRVEVLKVALDEADKELKIHQQASKQQQQQPAAEQLLAQVAGLEAVVARLQHETQLQAQKDNSQKQQQHQQQPGTTQLLQQVADLQAQVARLTDEKEQLLQQVLQLDQVAVAGGAEQSQATGLPGQPTAPISMALAVAPEQQQHQVLYLQTALLKALLDCRHCQRRLKAQDQGMELLRSGASAAGVDCQQVQALADSQQQLGRSQRKVKQLAETNNKLEAMLKDLEAAAAEEKEQFIVQLSAANQELRRTSQQLAATQQQLANADKKQQWSEQQLVDAELAAIAASGMAPAAAAGAEGSASDLEVDSTADTGNDGLTQVIALADKSAAQSANQEALLAAQEQVTELQKQLAEADSSRRGLDKEVGRLRKQLVDEQAERATLEEQLAQHLEDNGDDMAQEAVAAYEAKYSRLKSRYRELTESHREEVDALHDEIAALQERTLELEAVAAQLEAARSQAQHGEATLAETLLKSSKANTEIVTLRAENQELMQALVAAKLELAQIGERELISRRELYKAKETNMKLASKMTKLETLVYKK